MYVLTCTSLVTLVLFLVRIVSHSLLKQTFLAIYLKDVHLRVFFILVTMPSWANKKMMVVLSLVPRICNIFRDNLQIILNFQLWTCLTTTIERDWQTWIHRVDVIFPYTELLNSLICIFCDLCQQLSFLTSTPLRSFSSWNSEKLKAD